MIRINPANRLEYEHEKRRKLPAIFFILGGILLLLVGGCLAIMAFGIARGSTVEFAFFLLLGICTAVVGIFFMLSGGTLERKEPRDEQYRPEPPVRIRFAIHDLLLVITLFAVLSAGIAFLLLYRRHLAEPYSGPRRVDLSEPTPDATPLSATVARFPTHS